ncbi:hypothetical protein K435DRAFT_964635 [Dendrothele bispora CBS 962.96]|uniref:Uncharacterized protein n=1 Tax=Dendrothele bispora (strain CBS 962.96) TaxID=1314807 RepID=A0A4S8M9P4_DENBC|nr:hypothetical protein K435DRAFT_964635 [Dendrothele bispora CBS 962.96]
MNLQKLGFLVLLGITIPVRSANDWDVPCFDGVCEYDLPSTSGASGTLHIWGTRDAVSDITPAAGWEVIGCSPDALSQDIRLACTNPRGCDHLFQGTGGPEGKYVRLPENCGRSSFARVTKAWTPADQSVPPSIAPQVVKRDASAPLVHAVTLDALGSVDDPIDQEPVHFAIYAINTPGVDLSSVGEKVSQLRKRGYLDLIGATALEAITSNFNKSFNANVQKSFDTEPINIFSDEIQCGLVDSSLNITADAKLTLNDFTFAAFVAGTAHPIKHITNFSFSSDFSASLGGELNFKGDVSVQKQFNKDLLNPPFPIDILGLDFPPFVTIGPTFQVQTELDLDFDVAVDLTVGLNYELTNGHLGIAKNLSSDSSADFQIGDTPLSLSAGSSIDATASISVHLIPTLDFGIEFFDNLTSADVFLNLDASATLQLSAGASHNTSLATVQSRNTDLDLLRKSSVAGAISAAKAKEVRQVSNDDPSLCADISVGLDVNAGLSGIISELPFLNQFTNVPLKSEKFELFTSCPSTANVASKKRSLQQRDGLLCLPGNASSDLIPLQTGTTISHNQIHPKSS